MELKAMLHKRLTEDKRLAEMLAEFCEQPAIFYGQAPTADCEEWGDEQYPRIDYLIDMQENPARNASGILSINAWCDADSGATPEEIEIALRDSLHAAFAQTDDYPYCFSWVRSDAFEASNQNEQTARTIGVTVIFDIMACPCQYTMYPDPIKAMNIWTKTVLPNAVVLGEDEIDGWLVPTKDTPVIYWQLAAQGIQQKHFTHTWLDITIEGHVCARTAADRLHNLVRINSAAALAGHIPLEDSSPLFLRNYTCRPNFNYLSQGQIQTGGRFGLLQPWYGKQPDPKLNKANFTMKE